MLRGKSCLEFQSPEVFGFSFMVPDLYPGAPRGAVGFDRKGLTSGACSEDCSIAGAAWLNGMIIKTEEERSLPVPSAPSAAAPISSPDLKKMLREMDEAEKEAVKEDTPAEERLAELVKSLRSWQDAIKVTVNV